MTALEQQAVDDALQTARRDAAAAEMDAVAISSISLRAFVQLLIKEINILRGQHALADRTIAQFKTQYRAELEANGGLANIIRR
jgi:hypothetical protein